MPNHCVIQPSVLYRIHTEASSTVSGQDTTADGADVDTTCPTDRPSQSRLRGAIFGKMTNRNQTDTNKMATTETKYQTYF